MYRLKEDHMEELEIKKSRFLCYLHRCECEEEAKAFVNQIKRAHPAARHACYAFVIGEHNELQRSNDDGEPAGTAGVPMLECLTQRNMQDIVAVTVRYFGGIKLGAGGLIRAYSKSVANALDTAVLTRKQLMKIYRLSFSYDLIGKMDYFFRSENLDIITKDYNELVTYEFASAEDVSEDISAITNGAYLPEYLREVYADVELR